MAFVLDLSRWPLLEQPAPDLCADRIDYTLQDRIHYDQMDKQSISKKTGQRVSLSERIRVLSNFRRKKSSVGVTLPARQAGNRIFNPAVPGLARDHSLGNARCPIFL